MNGPTAHERAFITYLAGLAGKTEAGEEDQGKPKNLAALAALRRGLGKNAWQAAEMFPYVVRFIGDNLPPQRQGDYFLVASLFAFHQLIWKPTSDEERTNLGASFRRLDEDLKKKRGLGNEQDKGSSVEKRFVALLNADREDVPEHLRHAISLLKAHDIPVDWARLFHDLGDWAWESRSVQSEWSRAFWRESPPAASTAG